MQNTAQDLPVVSISKSGESFSEREAGEHSLAGARRSGSVFTMPRPSMCAPTKKLPGTPSRRVIAELGEAKFEVKMVTAPTDAAARRRR